MFGKIIYKNITYRYLIALMLIGVLSTIAFINVNKLLNETYSNANVVNISGKQRMISQHIALDLHYIAENNGMHNIAYISERLVKNSTLMLYNNHILSVENAKNMTHYSQEIDNIYFGEINLSKRVIEYALKAKEFSKLSDKKKRQKILRYIALNSEPLLIDLNNVVKQYQLESEAKINNIGNMETMVWFLTLSLLLFEAIFIFNPLSKNLSKLYSEKMSLLKNLKKQVNSKTVALKKSNENLKKLAFHDTLTGLRNRLSLESDVDNIISQYHKHGIDFAFLILDIDFFKDVNDTYGHDIGDRVLEELSKIFKTSFRENDKVYRAGGEEFVILLNRIDLQTALKVANKCRLRVSEHNLNVGDFNILKTVSGGLYHSSVVNVHDYKEVFKFSDLALYKAKDSGRNRIEVYDSKKYYDHVFCNTDKVTIIIKDKTTLNIDTYSHDSIHALGYLEEEFDSIESFKELVHEEDYDILDLLADEFKYSGTIRLYGKQRKISIFQMDASIAGNSLFIELESSVSLFKNVGGRGLIESFNAMLDITVDYIYFKDKHHVFIAGSKTLVDITKVSNKSDFPGKTDYELFDKEYADKYFKLEKDVLSGELEVAQEYQVTLDKNGIRGYVDNKKYPLKDKDGNIEGVFGIAKVIAQEDYNEKVLGNL